MASCYYVGDFWLVARSTLIAYLVLGLTIFGLVMVGNASVVDALRDFGNKWYYLKLQAGWAGLGLVGFIVAAKLPYKIWEKHAPALFGVTVLLLLVVLIPGIGSKILGARRWISLGIFSFQPAELAKLTVGVYFASLLKKPNEKLLAFLALLGILIGLIMLEPDLGTTIVLVGMSLMIYFGSGGKIKYLAMLAPIGIAAVGLLILLSPYRLNRIKTYLDYSRDPLGASYHIRQVLLSIGSGGITGVGLGQSKQKYEFLPEVTTDSIFAVIGEEFGLIGGTVVVVTFLALVLLGLGVAQRTTDKFGANLAIAISAWIATQAFVNISAMVALLPLTGIPLPFISYGGSALVILLFASGILVNIAKSNK